MSPVAFAAFLALWLFCAWRIIGHHKRETAPAAPAEKPRAVSALVDVVELRNRDAVRAAFKSLQWSRDKADQVWARIDHSGSENDVITRAVKAASSPAKNKCGNCGAEISDGTCAYCGA